MIYMVPFLAMGLNTPQPPYPDHVLCSRSDRRHPAAPEGASCEIDSAARSRKSLIVASATR